MLTTIVGERGQITIPKEYRKRLGIQPKTPVEIDITSDGILIRPTITIPLRSFSDEFISDLVAADTLNPGEKESVLAAWNK